MPFSNLKFTYYFVYIIYYSSIINNYSILWNNFHDQVCELANNRPGFPILLAVIRNSNNPRGGVSLVAGIEIKRQIHNN